MEAELKRARLRKSIQVFTLVLGTLLCSVPGARAYAQQQTPGYDVVLLVGQSNMVGWGQGPDNPRDAAVDPRVFQWNPTRGIISARDPLAHQGASRYVGLGLTFGKTYVQALPSDRRVLLVGAGWGGTSVISGRWKPGGDLFKGAVARANAAMAAAGPGAKFAGILWHQGEADVTQDGAPTYRESLDGIISTFRSSITGANGSTPFVVGELTREAIARLNGTRHREAVRTILDVFHTLPQRVPYTAWVSSARLPSNANDWVHFSALSQRTLGRRYADALILATRTPALDRLACNGQIYLSSGNSRQGKMYVGAAGPDDISWAPIGPMVPAYDAISVDPISQYLYGISRSNDQLFRINNKGAVTDLGQIAGLPSAPTYDAGAFDAAGNFYGATTAMTAPGILYRIDVTKQTVMAAIPLSLPVNSPDLAYANSYLWGVARGSGEIQRIDPATGTVSNFPSPLLESTPAYSGAFTYENGDLGFINHRTRTIIRVAVENPDTATPAFSLVSTQYMNSTVAGTILDATACTRT
jgi:hypothetical protein